MTDVEMTVTVSEAIEGCRPVVALESTLITHGLPYPENLDTARMLEAEVLAGGAIPATVAILDGRIRVGLTGEELEFLARLTEVRKCSRRDIGIVVGRGGHGATTVAATMALASRAGIRVFATGGIGGVHRGAPFDISADLEELGRSRMLVVCAGAKAILDLPLTLEALETRGVPVIGYGTDAFPAFYTPSSGLGVDVRCDSAAEVVAIARAHWDVGLGGGVLVTVPVPADDALDEVESLGAIDQAVAEAGRRGIRGKDATPFLLARVSELTGGRSRAANIALLRNNARTAAAIACAWWEGVSR